MLILCTKVLGKINRVVLILRNDFSNETHSHILDYRRRAGVSHGSIPVTTSKDLIVVNAQEVKTR